MPFLGYEAPEESDQRSQAHLTQKYSRRDLQAAEQGGLSHETAKKYVDHKLHLYRAVAYIVMFLLSFLCLFFFYILIDNATHNNFDIQKGFQLLPGGSFLTNLKNTMNDANVPVLSGLRNSLIVAGCSAALSCYFSALTAYAIYAYDFKFKNAAFTIILLIMTMPMQVSALGFPSPDGQYAPDQYAVAADFAQHCSTDCVLFHEAIHGFQPAEGTD